MAEVLELVADQAKVALRVQFSRRREAEALLDLPGKPLTVHGGDPQALWLAPDQWLITSDTESAEALIRRCDSALSDLLHSATDASSALTTFRLEHPHAATLLAMGSALDFDGLAPGECARTRLARIAVVVVPLSRTGFDLYLDRSYARYLARWMLFAATDPMYA